MPYKIYQFQNTSGWDKESPSIILNENDPNWEQYYKNWTTGKDPSNSPEWKKGIFALSKEV